MGTILSGQVKWILIGLMAIGGLAAVLGTASQAIWTDTDDVADNVFNTGSVSLTAADSPSPMWNVTAGTPGDRETGSVTVTNAGTMELRYSVTGANVGDAELPAGMNLRISLQVNGSCDFPYHDAAGDNIAHTDDTPLFTGTFDTTALIGNPNPGDDVSPGGGDRVLAAAATEDLCFAVVLPNDAANSLQTKSNTATFTFDSEQTANNP
jgi:predicted ribosomally synthesized peptide with SipW-like signal peptide